MTNTIPLIHKISDFYKNIYLAGKKADKRDRFGLCQKIEAACLDALCLSIEAAYLPRTKKQEALEKLRLKIEIIKQLIRLAKEINALNEKQYLDFAGWLIEISKMNNGWLGWSSKKEG